MNANHPPQPDHERLEALLTAHALGELKPEDLAEVRRVASSPEAQRLIHEMSLLAAALRQPAQAAEPAAALVDAIDKRLEQETVAMRSSEPKPRKGVRLLYVLSIVAAASIAVAFILPALQAPRESRRTLAQRSDAEAPPATASAATAEPGEPLDMKFAEPFPDAPSELPNLASTVEVSSPTPAEMVPKLSGDSDALMIAPASSPPAGRSAPAPAQPGSGEAYPDYDSLRESYGSRLPADLETERRTVILERNVIRRYALDANGTSKTFEFSGNEATTADLSTEGWVNPADPADPRMRRSEGRHMVREQYEAVAENPFLSAAKQPLSTFAIDVDTASYANVRRFLTQGMLPPPAAVRIEELVNYFRYDYSPPTGRAPFAVHLESAECPWNGKHRLVRVGLKGKEIDRNERGASNLVFLLDVSGSMMDQNKLPLVKQAMSMLVEQLGEDDRVAIVTYAGNAGLVLDSTNGDDKGKILRAIDSLGAGGSTHGSAGIKQAYEQAVEHFIKGGVNRLIWATDGDLNVGVTGDDELVQMITEKAKTGVFLTVLGVGTGNLQDAKLEKMANKGNGVYAYLDTIREARKVLVEQMTGSLVTIAKDVKIQVEFNPAEVQAYRLVGYENRMMANKDFRNDEKDAGEIGAGHTVTALYEVAPAGAGASIPEANGLKYQQPAAPDRELTDAANNGELLTVRLRYKEPDGNEATEIEFPLTDGDTRFGEASADFRFASSVAAFGLILRNSQYRGELTLAAVEEFAAGALGNDEGGYRAEFVDLLRRAKQISGR
jgi:Ca-activated chloride channel family protein